MSKVTVRLIKPFKDRTITYEGEVIEQDSHHILLRAVWQQQELVLPYVVLNPGDVFLEHYYSNKWYNIFEIFGSGDKRKGWYCNISKPAVFEESVVTSEDLDIDVFIPADKSDVLVLDMEEFESRGYSASDPHLYKTALEAVEEILKKVKLHEPPF